MTFIAKIKLFFFMCARIPSQTHENEFLWGCKRIKIYCVMHMFILACIKTLSLSSVHWAWQLLSIFVSSFWLNCDFIKFSHLSFENEQMWKAQCEKFDEEFFFNLGKWHTREHDRNRIFFSREIILIEFYELFFSLTHSRSFLPLSSSISHSVRCTQCTTIQLWRAIKKVKWINF